MMSRQLWGEIDGVAKGSDVALEAVLTVDGAIAPSQVTSSGIYSVSLQTATQPAQSLLTDELSDVVTASSGLVRWNITSAQTATWTVGTSNGDIKLVDSGGTITYWPVSLRVRSVVD